MLRPAFGMWPWRGAKRIGSNVSSATCSTQRGWRLARQKWKSVRCRSANSSIESSRAMNTSADTIFGDAFRLEQALTNITTNALRHTREGGRIALHAERGDGSLILSVSDDGEGIAPEHLPLIFDRFYKATSKKGAPAGSGLGLYIVKTIAARHGGKVSAVSEVGHGTTIRIELPHHEDHMSADPRHPDVGIPPKHTAA